MLTNNTQQFIQKLAQQKEVTSHLIQEIITTAFRNSYCQNENNNADLYFEFNDDLLVYRLYQIVEKVNDPIKEITRDNQLIAEGKIKGNVFFQPVDTKKISFSLSQEIKKELARNLEKIRKEKEYKIYSPLQDQIVSGHLQSIADDHYVINLGKGYGYWEKKERLFSEEKLHLGQKLFFLLKEVRKEGNYCRIILTRRHDLFLQKVLELEIPEVKNQIVIIRDILRLTDSVSKVIIESKNPQLNVLGTCIGRDATRIRSICQITYPERVEMVKWQENKKELFFNLLAPAPSNLLNRKRG